MNLNYCRFVYSTIRVLINIKKYIQNLFYLSRLLYTISRTTTTTTTIRNNNNDDNNNDDDDDDEREKSGRQYIDRYVYF